jgi:hypothetical protein
LLLLFEQPLHSPFSRLYLVLQQAEYLELGGLMCVAKFLPCALREVELHLGSLPMGLDLDGAIPNVASCIFERKY